MELPQRTIDLLVRFLGQGEGALSKRARRKEFGLLTDAEIQEVEVLYTKVFGGVNA